MERSLLDAVGGALEVNLSELLRQRLVQEIAVPAPAPGAEWSVKVPNVAYWELLGAAYLLTTSAVVANRRSSLRIRDANAVFLGQADSPAVQAAGVAQQYAYSEDVGAPQAIVVNTQTIPLEGVPLSPGWSIGSITQLIDVGDQYSAIVLVIREWTFEELVRQAEWLARHTPDLAAEPRGVS